MARRRARPRRCAGRRAPPAMSSPPERCAGPPSAGSLAALALPLQPPAPPPIRTIRPARPSRLGPEPRMRFTWSRRTAARSCSPRADRRRSPAAASGGAQDERSRSMRSGCARPAAMPASATRPASSSAKTACRPASRRAGPAFRACNFMFMGGAARFVDPGGLFIVHMFTHTADRRRSAACSRHRQHGRPDRRHRAGFGPARQRGQRLPDPHGRLAAAAHRGDVPPERGAVPATAPGAASPRTRPTATTSPISARVIAVEPGQA